MKHAGVFWSAFKARWKKGMQAYSGFMEKQGFYLVLGICVLVIVGTAVWTRTAKTPQRPPATQTGQPADAPYEGVQNLSDVTPPGQASSTPVPSATPAPSFSRPIDGALVRGFDAEKPAFFESAGVWQVHAACDYQAETGAVVTAIVSGTVVGLTDSGVLGKTVTIDHGNGYVALYGSLSMNSYVKLGDPIRAGQSIGHVGQTALYEAQETPHLHLYITKNGQPVDPETLFAHTNK